MNKFKNLRALLKGPGNSTSSQLPSFVDLQCGTTVWSGVPVQMRTELWLSIVQRRSGSGLAARQQYYEYLQMPVPEEVLDAIAKDTARTFPGIAECAHRGVAHIPHTPHHAHRLNTRGRQVQFANVLRAYAAYDSEVGYCQVRVDWSTTSRSTPTTIAHHQQQPHKQGMNFLAGLLLAYIEYEEDVFGLLVVLLKDRKLRELYRPSMTMLQVLRGQRGFAPGLTCRMCMQYHVCQGCWCSSTWPMSMPTSTHRHGYGTSASSCHQCWQCTWKPMRPCQCCTPPPG